MRLFLSNFWVLPQHIQPPANLTPWLRMHYLLSGLGSLGPRVYCDRPPPGQAV